jgi:hypothetical protein
MKAMLKIERAFLWAASDKISGGKCEVKWDVMCRPKNMGGLGILDLNKFARALRLRWPLLEWTDPGRPWVGLGNPCDKEDMDVFYSCITIAIGNVRTTKFRHSPWLGGIKPKDIAPSILEISKLKILLVHKALQHDFWVANLNLTWGISLTHIKEFYPSWVKLP